MIYSIEEAQKDVIWTLATMTAGIEYENGVGFFDSNRTAQEFFVGFFAIMFKYRELVELDIKHDTTSFPAIDIGDSRVGIGIQVTSRNDKDKIVETVDKYIKNNLHLTYPRLVILILGKKLDYRNTIDVSNVFDFNIERDVWDMPYICKEIKKLDIDDLKLIKAYLTNFLRSTERNVLYDQDIADGINILRENVYKVLEKVDKGFTQLRLPNREDGFIGEKNTLNNLTWDDFNIIQGHLLHNEKFTNFLINPNNEQITVEYLELAKTLQKHYTSNKSEYENIDVFMRNIFKSLDTYDSNLDTNKIKIILHNMYFNCDIGDNPVEN